MAKQKKLGEDYLEKWDKESKGKFKKLENILKEFAKEKNYSFDYKVTGTGDFNPPAYLLLKKEFILFFPINVPVLEASLMLDDAENRIEHFANAGVRYKKKYFADSEIERLFEMLKGISKNGPYFYEWET